MLTIPIAAGTALAEATRARRMKNFILIVCGVCACLIVIGTVAITFISVFGGLIDALGTQQW